MVEWNGFDYRFDYGNDCVYGNSFGLDFDYAYGNRKGPHKQSLIVKCLSDFQNSNIFHFLKAKIDILR